MSGFYELQATDDGKFIFNLRAGNNEVILTSQTYTSKAAAMDGIATVQRHGRAITSFEARVASSNAPFFVLTAHNGQIIGTSELYSTPSARDNGIASVIHNSHSNEVRDLTTRV
jgi:uncharacterized protein